MIEDFQHTGSTYGRTQKRLLQNEAGGNFCFGYDKLELSEVCYC